MSTADEVINAFRAGRSDYLQNRFRSLASQYAAAPAEQRDAIGAQLYGIDPASAEKLVGFTQQQSDLKLAAQQRQAKQTAFKLYSVANAPPGQAEGVYQAVAPEDYQTAIQGGLLTPDMPPDKRDQLIRQTAAQHLPNFMAQAGLSTAPELKTVGKDQSLVGISPMGGPPQQLYKGETAEVAPIKAEDFSPDSVAKFKQSGNYNDLVRTAAPKDTTNSQLIQTVDPETKQPIWKLVDKGTGATINPNVGEVGPKGAASGGREATMFNRVIMSASQATKSAENLMNMSANADRGAFGTAVPGTSLLGSTKSALANSLRTQDSQSYNVVIAGITRALAGIESAGLMPSGTLVHQMDAVVAQPGDTGVTRLRKMAEIRQIMSEGINTYLDNPRIPPEQKTQIQKLLDRMEKAIPFTQDDVSTLEQSQNPKVTMADIVKLKLKPQNAQPTKNAKGWALHQDAQGNKAYVSPDGKQFEPVQ